jgi:hypothetical protein
VVEVRPKPAAFGELKPDVMDTVDILGPQARRMGAEVDELRAAVRFDDFE